MGHSKFKDNEKQEDETLHTIRPAGGLNPDGRGLWPIMLPLSRQRRISIQYKVSEVRDQSKI